MELLLPPLTLPHLPLQQLINQIQLLFLLPLLLSLHLFRHLRLLTHPLHRLFHILMQLFRENLEISANNILQTLIVVLFEAQHVLLQVRTHLLRVLGRHIFCYLFRVWQNDGFWAYFSRAA